MIKRLIELIRRELRIGYKPHGMKYVITNNEVTITALCDTEDYSIDVPEFIEDYPVTDIKHLSVGLSSRLKYVNGIRIEPGVNIINNKFILFYRPEYEFDKLIYKIKYKIGDDYVGSRGNDKIVRFILNNSIL